MKLLSVLMLLLSGSAMASQTILLPPTTTVSLGGNVVVGSPNLGYSIQCSESGASTAAITATIALQGTNDGTHYINLATFSLAGTGNGIGVLCTANADGSDPCSAAVGSNVPRSFRASVTAIAGSSATVSCLIGE